ncbi:MAG: hypothetical protein Q8L62_04870 [Candidatus Nitrotoga sp.]|nr:hypothetical protein [Candidatus Nitrotoga sp.]
MISKLKVNSLGGICNYFAKISILSRRAGVMLEYWKQFALRSHGMPSGVIQASSNRPEGQAKGHKAGGRSAAAAPDARPRPRHGAKPGLGNDLADDGDHHGGEQEGCCPGQHRIGQ